MTRWILASASPRRRELLQKILPEFEVIPAVTEERCENPDPGEYVLELAGRKAEEIFEREVVPTFRDRPEETAVVIGADTIVVTDDEITGDPVILGKPRSREDAANMLRLLQDSGHSVITGVVIAWADKNMEILYGEDEEPDDWTRMTGYPVSFDSVACETRVYVHHMSEKEIASYLETGEADDKAGAYGIQGTFGKFIDMISGDYYNVVGLPVSELYRMLKRNLLLEDFLEEDDWEEWPVSELYRMLKRKLLLEEFLDEEDWEE